MHWQDWFPFPSWRDLQAAALDFLTENLNNADDLFVEAPTGIGKSAIAIALARLVAANRASTYISTTTVELEDQYINDFYKLGLRQLHGKSHYRCIKCDFCDTGSINVKGKQLCQYTKCPYLIAKQEFFDASLSITNAAFLLTNARFVPGFDPRELAIFDEAHLLHETIAKQYAFEIYSREVQFFPDEDHELPWLKDHYRFWLTQRIDQLEEEFGQAVAEDDPELDKIGKRLDAARRKLQNLSNLLADDPNNWIFDQQLDHLSIAPIWATAVAGTLLPRIGSKRIYLSATLPGFTEQARYLGIDPQKAKFLALDSPFPVEHRLIHVCPLVEWDYRDPEPAIATTCQVLKQILRLHPEDRGLVHVSSYPQARQIVERLNNPRVVTHTNSVDKQEQLAWMFENPGIVLVSPSSHEGLDLYGERSRFQVIAKLPFASLGDKRVKRRNETDRGWYALNTAQKLIQACGRSIRSDDDHAVTYIIDKDFHANRRGGPGFFARAHRFFPKYFTDALRIDEVNL